jgi:hypothetical protein
MGYNDPIRKHVSVNHRPDRSCRFPQSSSSLNMASSRLVRPTDSDESHRWGEFVGMTIALLTIALPTAAIVLYSPSSTSQARTAVPLVADRVDR